MHRSLGILVSALCIIVFCLFCSTSYKPYEAPEKKDLGENTFEYVDSPLYEGSDAEAFNPELGTPEAVVVKFLSSRARGDKVWEETVAPPEERNDRLNRILNKWNDWKLTKWQLKRLEIDDDEALLMVYFEIIYDGDKTDDGEDEFELELVNGVWMIKYPPA